MASIRSYAAEKKYGISSATIRNLCRKGLVKHAIVENGRCRTGYSFDIDEDSLEAYITDPKNGILDRSLRIRRMAKKAEEAAAPRLPFAAVVVDPGPVAVKTVPAKGRRRLVNYGKKYLKIPADLVPIRQAAKDCGVSTRTVYARVQDDTLRGFRIGRIGHVSAGAAKKALAGLHRSPAKARKSAKGFRIEDVSDEQLLALRTRLEGLLARRRK